MKVILLDISGKVLNYDLALFETIRKEAEGTSVRFLAPRYGLLSLIPKKWQYSENIVKRLVKVAEGLLNYAYTCIKVTCAQPDVLHLQWLPFMEFVGWEISILKCLKRLSPRTRFVLTIHNVYPHNMSDVRKKVYKERFRKACSLFDAFIVHTKISKEDVIKEFGLKADKVYVCCHGVFESKGVTLSSEYRKDGKLRILQFGGQSFYKGTDLLVDAVCGLDKNRKDKIETRIVGGINQHFYESLVAKDSESQIIWKPYYLKDEELYQEINNADLIVLPYRAISQSGVLLLSIFFEKLVICSDLPSFVETMEGDEGKELNDFLFFMRENVASLRDLLVKYIDGVVNVEYVRKRIKHLKELYCWDNAAKATLDVYKN